MEEPTQLDRWRRRAALGYIELGMPEEAERELAEMSPGGRMNEEAIILRLHLAQHWHDWQQASALSEMLVQRHPGNVEWRILLAYSVRRSESLGAARQILVNALENHSREAILHFNLSCYACVAGDLSQARHFLREAIRLDKKYARVAKTDEDLSPLHGEVKAIAKQAKTLALPPPPYLMALPDEK